MRECLAGGERERWRLCERAPPLGEPGHSGDFVGPWGASRGGAGYLGGGGSPPLSMDLPRRGVVPGELGDDDDHKGSQLVHGLFPHLLFT